MRLPKFKWNRRIGSSGEKLIDSRLSKIALVNKYTEDAGLDFYCERLFRDMPDFTFFVQAKGTGHFDKNWGTQIPKTTISYWLERPGPVYLFVADVNNEKTYWESIEEKRYWLYNKINESDTNSIYFKVGSTNELNNENYRKFEHQLNSDIISFYTNSGTPPIVGRGYVRHVPTLMFTNEQRQTIFDTVRFSLYHLIQDSIQKQKFLEAKNLIECVIKLGSGHSYNYIKLAEVYSALRDSPKSLENYKIALKVINEDPQFLATKAGQNQKDFVEKKIKGLEPEEKEDKR